MWQRISGSFRLRLTILVLLVVLLPVLAVAFFNVSQGSRSLRQNAEEQLQSQATLLADTVATWEEATVLALQNLSTQPDIVSMDAAQQEPVLTEMADVYTYMYLIATTDMAGVNVARSDDAAPKDYHDRAWFLGAAAGNEITRQSLIGRSSGEPAVVFSAPIRDAQNKLTGVALVATDLTVLGQQVGAVRIGETGLAFLVDANGFVLAHPDPAFSSDELVDLNTHPAVQKTLSGQGGILAFTDEEDVNWLSYSIPLDNGWGVVVQQTEAEILEPITQFRRVNLLVSLLLVMGISLLTWAAASRLVHPMKTLTDAAAAFADGQLETAVAIDRNDELGILAKAFNSMTAQLQGLIANLETRVADRTSDLTLAAEVGRRVSQIRDLDVLLDAAAEMIRDHFDLYHTQIYLTDSSGQNLILKASTGDVGKQLLRRSHHLPIEPGSINGMAAVDKKPIIVADTSHSSFFQPNPLLPNTHSEMAVPLLLEEQVVGVLDLQSDQPNALSEENLIAYTSLAGQLAVAVDNARLFAESAQARARIETQSRRLTRERWQEFLDSFSQRERVGYVYDHTDVVPFTNAVPSVGEQAIAGDIMIAGESIGKISMEGEPGQIWTEESRDLVQAIARQVGQRIENLRLLAETNHYRDEAEQAVRRLTHEGWQRYESDLAETGFVFDQHEVKPVDTAVPPPAESTAVTQDLHIQGVNIGQLVVAGIDEVDETTAEMVTAVANQLSAHIENLRLTAQTEEALAATAEQALRLARLNEMGADLGKANTVDDVFTAVTQHMSSIVRHDRLSLALWEPDGQHLKIHTLNDDSGATPVTLSLLVDEPTIQRAMTQRRLINTANTRQSDLAEDAEQDAQAVRASLIVPLITARGVLGTLNIGSSQANTFDAQVENIMQQIAPLVASTIENQRLFAETQKQAEKERLVNTISQKIQGTLTMESALQTTIQELGQALQARYTQVKLGNGSEKSKLEEVIE